MGVSKASGNLNLPAGQAGIRMFLQILFKSLKVRKSRVFIAFLSVAIGATIITALLSVYFDISTKMSREMRTYGANFFIGPDAASGERAIDFDVYENIIRNMDSKLIGASPYVYGVVRLDIGNAVMAGVDFSGLKKLTPYWQVEGRWITVDFDEQHCMIGRSLAQNMELKVGDKVNVINRETGFQMTLTVRGIMETGQAEDGQIFVNLSLAQRILGLSGKINHAMLSIVTEDFDADALAAQIEKNYQGIDAKPLRKISYSEGKVLDKIRGLMAFIAIIILSITTLCVMTTLMAMVVERTREIGLMKALGADNGSIVRQFLSETFVIGVAGILAGLIAGFVLAQVLGQAVFGSSISFRILVLPLALIISLNAALLASVFPIRRAVSIVPAKVLSEE